jgi:division protein CdvB (Snf7/Vps24/ESCRT-III family)
MSDFEWWLVNCGADERELSNLYKQLNKAASTLHNMKTRSSEKRIKLINECWNLQRQIGQLLEEIDHQLQTAIDIHQERRRDRGGSGVWRKP